MWTCGRMLTDCGVRQQYREKYSPLISGFSLASLPLPSVPLCNSVLACNADRMCQQIMPNETHLFRSSVSLRSVPCQHGDTLIALAAPTPDPVSIKKTFLSGEAEWVLNPLRLTLGAKRKSDKMPLRLSDWRFNWEAMLLLLLYMTHKMGSSYEFSLCLGLNQHLI